MNRSLVWGLPLVLSALAAQASAQPNAALAEHYLNRAGYGPDDWTRQRLEDLGWRAYVDEQLDPRSIPDPELRAAIAQDPRFDGFTMNERQLRVTFSPRNDTSAGQRRFPELHPQARAEFYLRGIASRRQLQAVLSEFWFNHFNVTVPGRRVIALPPYVKRIRANALGKFEDLLLAVAKSPAMLEYLDNKLNFKTGFRRDRKTLGINENYARELLELHTLGVEDDAGVYDQADIIAAARCLTGWTYDVEANAFEFVAPGHDSDPKRVIRYSAPANGGIADGEGLLRYLARHPRTASFISAKLVTFFAGPGQSALASSARQVFVDTRGDIKRVVRHILLSQAFAGARDAKLKRPTLWLISAMRASRAELGVADARFRLLNDLWALGRRLGLPQYEVQPPTGWDDLNDAFLNPGSILDGYDALNGLFHRRVGLGFNPAAPDAPRSVRLIAGQVFFGAGISPQTRDALRGYYSALPASLSQRERGRRVLALTLATPEFLQH